jgi:hypothetical protein
MTPADAIAAVKRLQEFVDHEDPDRPSTFAVFLSLTGNLEQGGTVEAGYLGYMEADMLSQALLGWCSYPLTVVEYLDSECL